ncbi:MAG: discoidin domain-containing protein, partial [Clostridiales bacterium]|nr:discoidin domain-containing protein [Clostridiales bacterium]
MKKSVQRKLAVMLSLAMAAAAFPAGMTGAAADGGAAAPGVLFSSSFEEGEPNTLVESEVDSHTENVNGKFTLGTLKGDLTGSVLLDSVDGSTDFMPEEGKLKLFDYTTGSKFLNQHSSISESNPVWVSFEIKTEAVVRTYMIASANDAQGRDPKNWTLYGSADGEDWKPLDSQTNQTFSERFEEKVYTFENETAYKYYKLAVTANQGEGMTQFS